MRNKTAISKWKYRMRKSEINIKHVSKKMPSSFSQIRLHLQLTVMYLEVCSTFDILLFPIPNIGFQLKLANQAWPTFEVCTGLTEMLDFLFSDQYFHLLDFPFSDKSKHLKGRTGWLFWTKYFHTYWICSSLIECD